VTDTENHILEEALLRTVQGFIERRDSQGLRQALDRVRPADLADLLEHLESEARLFVFNLMDPEGAGEVLAEIQPPVQERLLSDLDNERLSAIVQELPPDEAADLVGGLPPERAREIIDAVGEEVSEELERLLPYPEDSAGGIMTLEFVAVRADANVQDAIDTVRAKRREVEKLYYTWVVNDSGQLVGVLSLKELILEPPERKIAEIMNPDVIWVDVHSDQEEVARKVKKYNLVNVPVVDAGHRLVGRITYDDIMDVVTEEAHEDISLMGGVIDQQIGEHSTVKISRARLPWLILGLFGGIIAAAVVHRFEASLEKIIALSFFFPVLMAMGGNTGTQAATVVVRGLATGDIMPVHMAGRLWVELRVAVVNGLICAVLLGTVVGLWLANYRLGAVVGLAVLTIVLYSGMVGTAVPLLLKRWDVDPALATGPFVTTSNDILSLLIYLCLVTLLL